MGGNERMNQNTNTTSKTKALPIIVSAIVTILGLGLSIYGYVVRQSETYLQNAELFKSEGIVQGNNNLIDQIFIYGMIIFLIGILGICVSIYKNHQAKQNPMEVEHQRVKLLKLTQAALLTALCYIGFQYFRIDIPVGTEKTAIHFGNAFCVLAALLLGGLWGGFAGAAGMTLADLTSSYVTSAPKTFFLKLMIGLIVGLVAHKIAHINTRSTKTHLVRWTVIASISGMLFNVIADPIVGYFYKSYILGVPQDLAVTLAKIGAATTFVNAITSVLIASTLYLALRPALIGAGMFQMNSKETVRELKESK